MPRRWWPPTMGERPTTRARVDTSASRTRGTPRMVPTETTGLLGGTITRSASVIASMTPGAGEDSSSPTNTSASAGTSARSLTQYSWKCTTRRPLGASGSVMAMWVSTRSSVIGSRVTPGCQRRQSASVT